MDGASVGVTYTDIYTYYWWLGLAGSRHLAYLYVLFACFILRRPVSIFGPGGLLSVKQMDPVSFSAEIVNLILKLHLIFFYKQKEENKVLCNISFPKLGLFCHFQMAIRIF